MVAPVESVVTSASARLGIMKSGSWSPFKSATVSVKAAYGPKNVFVGFAQLPEDDDVTYVTFSTTSSIIAITSATPSLFISPTDSELENGVCKLITCSEVLVGVVLKVYDGGNEFVWQLNSTIETLSLFPGLVVCPVE